jgi:hypothetical protein
MNLTHNVVITCIVALLFIGCGDRPEQLRGVTKEERVLIARDTANYTYIKWLETSINFGTIRCGDKVKLIYRFKNVGEKPLFVINVTEACNCALTEFNTDPIQPGKQGTIQVTFDSKTQVDGIRKSIVVETNTFGNRYQELIFTGLVRDCCGGGTSRDEDDDDSPYIIKN